MILSTNSDFKCIAMSGALPCSFSFPVDSFPVLINNKKNVGGEKAYKIMFVAGQDNLSSCVTNLPNKYVLFFSSL